MRYTGEASSWTALQEWVYPAACFQCDRAISHAGSVFCTPCMEGWTGAPAATCSRCGSTVGGYSSSENGCPRCFGDRFRFEGVVRLGEYRDELKGAVLRMKRFHQEAFAHRFADWWAGRMAERLRPIPCDAVVPVPIHWRRRWSRGFNQARFLARSLAAVLRIPEAHCLKRTEWIADQKALSGAERRKNLRAAFRFGKNADVRGKRLLLVDDVLTSGATADACAGVLKGAGAASIAVAIVAKG